MYYTVYCTTNLINGNIYIGAHHTKNLKDGYMGSGYRFRAALKKYGASFFTKEVLFIFDNADEMTAKEAELVTHDFVLREDTYNLVVGGSHGADFYKGRGHITREMMTEWGAKGIESQRLRSMEDPHFWDHARQASRERTKLRWQTGAYIEHLPLMTASFRGQHHSETSKTRMAEKARTRVGEKNSQYGTRWMYHPTFGARKVKPDESACLSALGWCSGRTPAKEPKPKEGPGRGHNFSGRKHSEESKAKMRASSKDIRAGERNPSFGKMWVCKAGEKAKKVDATTLEALMLDGWRKGRK